MRKIAALSLTLIMSAPALAFAAEPKLEGKYTDWEVYTRHTGGDKICYVLSKPKIQSPRSVRHGDIYFMISNWKSGAAKEQPSFLAGYSLKTNRTPKTRVGKAKFDMYAHENEAFIENGSDERNLVSKMRAGSTMRVEAVSKRGTNVSYEFSLKGVTAALKKARSVCA